MPWHLYIVECKDSKLYTGITNNLKRRIRDHNSGNGCRYTSIRAPVKLVYSEELPTKSEALKRELRVKHLSRAEKFILIKNKSSSLKPSLAKVHKSKGR